MTMPDEASGQTATTASSDAKPRWQHPTGRNPEFVAIVACGPTQSEWHRANVGYHRPFNPPPEVWTLNKALRTVRADLGFVMDDMVGEGRRAETYRHDLDTCGVPIITSILDDEVRSMYPTARLHSYPLSEVLWYVATVLCMAQGGEVTPQRLLERRQTVCYQHNSLPYMLAYAMFVGVKRLMLFGVDYTHPSNPSDVREDDRANAEFWLGVLVAHGMQIEVPSSTTLLSTCYQKPMYGFGARQPLLDMPTAEDIAHYQDIYASRRARNS